MAQNHLNTPQGRMNAIMAVVVALGIVSFVANATYGKEAKTIPFSAEWWKSRGLINFGKGKSTVPPGYDGKGKGMPGYDGKGKGMPGYGQPGYEEPGYRPTTRPATAPPGYRPTTRPATRPPMVPPGYKPPVKSIKSIKK